MATNLKKTTTTRNTSKKTPARKKEGLKLLNTDFTYINFAEKAKEGGRFVMWFVIFAD